MSNKVKRIRFPLSPEIEAEFYRIKREMRYSESQTAQYLIQKGLKQTEKLKSNFDNVFTFFTDYPAKKKPDKKISFLTNR